MTGSRGEGGAGLGPGGGAAASATVGALEDPADRPGVVVDRRKKPSWLADPDPRRYRRYILLGAFLIALAAGVWVWLGRWSSRGPGSLAYLALGIVLFAVSQVGVTVWERAAVQSGKPEERITDIAVVLAAALAALGTLFFLVYSGTPMLVGLSVLIPVVLVVVGAAYIGRAVRRRAVGEDLFCAGCDYPYIAGAAGVCPECGGAWHGPKGLVRGRRPPVRRRLLWVGAGLVALGVLPAAAMIGTPDRIYANLPTGVLVRMATSGSAVDGAWEELRRRQLDESEVVALAEGHLAQRRGWVMYLHEGRDWFEGAIESGLLPDDIVRRYYSEMVEFWILAPDRVRAGEPFQVRLACAPYGYSFRTEAKFIFGGFWIDGQEPAETRQGRSGKLHSIVSLASEHHRYGKVEQHRERAPLARFEVATPGFVRVRAEYWLVVMPKTLRYEPTAWLEDGTPEVPGDALFVERVEIERVVEVFPSGEG